MSERGQNGPRSSAFKPQLEEMEGRLVPDAAGAVGNIFNIASQAIVYQAAVGNLKANLPLATQNAAVANQIKQIAGAIADVSAANNATLQQSAGEVVQAAVEITQNLNNLLAQATSDTIRDLNAQVVALQQQVESLPPAQQAAAQAALQKQVFTLADGAQVRLKQFRDLVGGQERAVVQFVSGLAPQYTITLGRTIQTEVEASQIEAFADAFDDGSAPNNGQTPPPNGGTFVQLGITLGDGTPLYGIDRNGDGVADGDDTYIRVNGKYQRINLP